MRTAANGDVGIKAAGYDGVIAEFFAEVQRLGTHRPAEAQANGRLFLAAPDMRDALDALLKVWPLEASAPCMYAGQADHFCDQCAEDKAKAQAEAALKKARGE